MPATLSPSRASDFMRCALQYRFRRVDRLPEPVGAAQARGILVHAVLEDLFDLPADRRTREQAEHLVAPTWERLVRERPELSEVVPAGEPHLAAWCSEAQALIERWFTLEDPRVLEPLEREYYVEAEVDGLMLRGYIDRVDAGSNGAVRIIDYKTGRAPGPQFELKAMFQLKFYALMLWRSTAQVPERLQLVYLGSGEVLSYVPQEQDLTFVARKIAAVAQAIDVALRSGQFLPAPGGHCGFCAYRQICPAWGGVAPPMPTPVEPGDRVDSPGSVAAEVTSA